MAIFFKTPVKFPVFATKLIQMTVEKANRSPIRAYSGHPPKRGKKGFLPCRPGTPVGSDLQDPLRQDPEKLPGPARREDPEFDERNRALREEPEGTNNRPELDSSILSSINPGTDPFDFYKDCQVLADNEEINRQPE